jgi:hypothetical protein
MSLTREQLTANLLRPDELADASLEERDLDALRAVADWIETFVARPNAHLGRAGTVCPFVPGALERHTLWLAAERVGDRSAADLAELVTGYQRLFLEAQPTDGDDAVYKSFVVVFADLAADRAQELFDDVLGRLAVPSYEQDGFVMGGFSEANRGTAIFNPAFRPFMSPVPFLLIRQAVVSDWKFFLDDEQWLGRWAHRFGEAGTQALAEEVRRLPWREGRD